MNEEVFYPITKEDFDNLVANKGNTVMNYVTDKTFTRKELNDPNYIVRVAGYNHMNQNIGLIDVWDVWLSGDSYYLRHYEHDSTD
jgi:hypothetical protein